MVKPRVLFIDNYDSFSFMLADYLQQQSLDLNIVRNNADLQKLKEEKWDALVLSPGPGAPEHSGICMEALAYWGTKIPVLGVCLGHQMIGLWLGANLTKATKPIHGKIDPVEWLKEDDLNKGIPTEIKVTRYHSLIIEVNKAESLEVLAISKTDSAVMAIRHKNLPIWGLQFHPEALGTEFGLKLIENWTKGLSRSAL